MTEKEKVLRYYQYYLVLETLRKRTIITNSTFRSLIDEDLIVSQKFNEVVKYIPTVFEAYGYTAETIKFANDITDAWLRIGDLKTENMF